MHYSRLVDITAEFLAYRSDNGEIAHISFKECAENFRNHMRYSGEFGETPKAAEVDDFKVVGWRDAFARPMYIEIFSSPRFCIEFPKSWCLWNPYKKFSEVQCRISRAGWSTLDLG